MRKSTLVHTGKYLKMLNAARIDFDCERCCVDIDVNIFNILSTDPNRKPVGIGAQ
jgi:hypothetical protein